MLADRHIVEEALRRDLESLSVSKKLARSVSQKLRKKRIHRSAGGEEDTTNGFALRCLTLYGRGGGCKVGADTSEEFGDSSNRRKSSASEEGKGYKPMCGAEETGVDCFSYGRKERFWKRNNRKEIEFEESQRNSIMNLSLPDDILEMCLMRLPLSSLMNARLVCKKWNYLTTTPQLCRCGEKVCIRLRGYLCLVLLRMVIALGKFTYLMLHLINGTT